MSGISEFRKRVVIDSQTAEKLGFVSDFEIDLKDGKILSVVVPKRGFLSSFFKNHSYVIPWENIEAIGKDIILVKNHLAEEQLYIYPYAKK